MTGLSPFVSAAAKIGVLAESDGVAILGLVLGRKLLARVLSPSAAQTADEAEGSTEACRWHSAST